MPDREQGREIVLTFHKHALKDHVPGSFFRPLNPRVKSEPVFIYDESIQGFAKKLSLMVGWTPPLKDGPYALPAGEIDKAEKARLKWLSEQFVTVANRIHRQAREKPDEDYRFHSLHPANGEWTARYVQKATGFQHDYTLTELKDLLRSHVSVDDLLKGRAASIEDTALKISDHNLQLGIEELKAIGPVIRPVPPAYSDYKEPAYKFQAFSKR